MRISPRSVLLLIVAAVVPALVLGVFVGALAAADTGTARVPAAIVNQDRLVQTAGANGKATTIAAGRLVVTGLTKPVKAGGSGASIDWRLSNASQAADLLKSGQVYAVVTIPPGFSRAISTVSGLDPQQARIRISTDDAHGYIVSQLASALGSSLTQSLGSTVSTGVIKGLYGGYSTLKTSLEKAGSGADKLGGGGDKLAAGLGKLATGQDGIASGATSLGAGAGTLASGADRLSSGLSTAATGARSAASGASQLSSGVTAYTRGVDRLAAGLSTAASSSSGLAQLPAGVSAYTDAVGSTRTALGQVLTDPTLRPATRAALDRIEGGLATLTERAPAASIVQGARGAAALQAGVASSASGADRLAAGSSGLRSGAAALAPGLTRLADGVDSSATGAGRLADGARSLATGASSLASGATTIAAGIRSSGTGATSLADGARSLGAGLTTGAAQVPSATDEQAARIATVVANPVRADAVRRHETTSIGQVVSALILPVALWIGASAAVLLFGAVRRRLLASGVGTGRLVGAAIGRGSLLALGQAVLLLGLLQATLPLEWSAVPLALLVAVVAGVSFFAVHQFLGAVFGRAGAVVSIVLLGFQLVAVGGLYPIELVSAPFQAVSPYLPLTAAVSAMQSVVVGAGGASVGTAIAVLAITALVAFAGTCAVTARRRASVGLFAPPMVPAIG